MSKPRSGNYYVDVEGQAKNRKPSPAKSNEKNRYFSKNDNEPYEVLIDSYETPIQREVQYTKQSQFDDRAFNYQLTGNYRLPENDKRSTIEASRYRAFQQKMIERSKINKRQELQGGRFQLFSFLSFLGLIMIWMGILISPLNRVNELIIEGNKLVDDQTIIYATGILPIDSKKEVMKQRQNIREQILLAIPLINDVSFDTSLLYQTKLTIEENVFIGQIDVEDQLLLVMSNGEVVSLQDDTSIVDLNTLPVLYGFTQKEQYINLANSLLNIDKNMIIQMKEIHRSHNTNKPNVIEIKMKDGNIVKANLYTLPEKITFYNQMLEQIGDQKGIINLEVGAYFSPMDQIGNSIKLDSNVNVH